MLYKQRQRHLCYFKSFCCWCYFLLSLLFLKQIVINKPSILQPLKYIVPQLMSSLRCHSSANFIGLTEGRNQRTWGETKNSKNKQTKKMCLICCWVVRSTEHLILNLVTFQIAIRSNGQKP